MNKTITLFFLFITTINCQIIPYTPLGFNEDITDWAHIASDNSFVDSTKYDGKNHFLPTVKPLLQDDYLYLATTSNVGGIVGGLIEKIDTKSGEVAWKYIFDTRASSIREAPIKLSLNKEGNLEVITLRLLEHKDLDFPYFILGTEVTFAIHVLNANNGKLIYHRYPPKQNRNHIFNSSHFFDFTHSGISNGISDFFLFDDNHIPYHVSREFRKDTQQYLIFQLDSNLNQTGTTRKVDLGLPWIVDDFIFGGLFQTKNYIVTLDGKIISSDNYKRIYSVKYWDTNWNPVYDLSNSFEKLIDEQDPFTVSIIDANDDMLLIRVTGNNKKFDYLYLFRVDGSLIKKFNLKLNNSNLYNAVFRYMIFNNDILALGTKTFQDSSKPQRFEVVKPGDSISVLASSDITPTNASFYISNIASKDDVFVLQGLQFKDSTINNKLIRYKQGVLYIKLNKTNTGLATKVFNYSNSSNILLLPNPNYGNLDIISEGRPIDIIKIFDSNGKLMKTTRKSKNIDLHKLPNGMYLINISLNSGEKIISKIIINK